MKRIRLFRLPILILCAALLLAACGTSSATSATTTSAATTTAAATTAAATAAGSGTATSAATTTAAGTVATVPATTAGQATSVASVFPVTVKDGTGADVVIKKLPQSIVITNVWAAEMLFEMVDTSRIKGLSMWSDKPAMTVTADKAKAVKARVSTQRAEEIVSLMPDLVVIDSFSDPDGSLAKTLRGAGAAVLSMQSPTDFTMIAVAIRTLAKAVGAPERGEALVADMEKTLNAVKAKVASVPAAERVKTLFFEAYYDQSGTNAGMLAAYGKGSTFDAIATAAGLVNVCNAPNYSAISKEKVVGEWKPDLLVVPGIVYDAKYEPLPDSAKTLVNAVLKDPLLKTLPAVQKQQVIALTEAYRGSTAQYMAKAVEELARAAYPKLFA